MVRKFFLTPTVASNSGSTCPTVLKLARISANAFRKFKGSASTIVPKGHPENSPAFQRWVQGQAEPRPEGTAELVPPILPVSRPFGTNSIDHGLPALKRRAIFDHPSGMTPAARLRNDFANSRKALEIAQISAFNFVIQVHRSMVFGGQRTAVMARMCKWSSTSPSASVSAPVMVS